MDNWQTWRKDKRVQLIANRKAITSSTHQQWSKSITTLLLSEFPFLKESRIGLYWPIHSEYDPRPAANYFREQGATLALPEVVTKHAPLCFRKWWPSAPMKNGAYQILTPNNTELVAINVIFIPMLGFDSQGYRLGYGSGYFDRTLATIKPYPLAIGVAFELSRIASVFPQPHDISMDFIVTETGVYQLKNNRLAATREISENNKRRK